MASLSTIVRAWYEVSQGKPPPGGDALFRFIAVWVAFNALYGSRYPKKHSEREQIIAFAGEPMAIDRHRELLIADQNYLDAVNYLHIHPVENLTRRRDGRAEIKEVENLNEVILAVYTARCNLFHGGKNFAVARDQTVANQCLVILTKLLIPYLDIHAIDTTKE